MASVAARLREEKSTICLFGTCRGGGRESSLKSCCYITFLEAMETRSTAQQPLGVWAAARCCCPVTQRGGVQVLCLTVPLPARALHGAVSARAGICLPPGQGRVPGTAPILGTISLAGLWKKKAIQRRHKTGWRQKRSYSVLPLRSIYSR